MPKKIYYVHVCLPKYRNIGAHPRPFFFLSKLLSNSINQLPHQNVMNENMFLFSHKCWVDCLFITVNNMIALSTKLFSTGKLTKDPSFFQPLSIDSTIHPYIIATTTPVPINYLPLQWVIPHQTRPSLTTRSMTWWRNRISCSVELHQRKVYWTLTGEEGCENTQLHFV